MHGSDGKNAAASFRKGIANGANAWTLRDLTLCYTEDHDKLADLNTEWKRNVAMPLQELCGIMSTVPKTDGDVRMVCAHGTIWRQVCKVASKEDREFNRSIAGPDDMARPGSSCLRTMEDRQILIDQLAALDIEILVCLWSLEVL